MILSTPDILFSLILLFFMFNGFRRGLIIEITRLSALFLSCFIASKYYNNLIPIIEEYFINEKIIQIISFLILFFSILIIINIISSLIQKLFEFIYLGWLNKLLGLLIGFIKGLIIISIIIFCMDILPEKTIKQIHNESTIYKIGNNIKDIIFSEHYKIENSMATFTMVRVLKSQQHYNQALAVLEVLESMGQDEGTLVQEKDEILKRISESQK